jgi:hypothetical protein
MRPETLKLVQERSANTLEVIGIGNNFLNRTQTAKQLKETINKWDNVICYLSIQPYMHLSVLLSMHVQDFVYACVFIFLYTILMTGMMSFLYFTSIIFMLKFTGVLDN